MTSSLVGSEMCIRDSMFGHPDGRQTRRRRAGALYAVQHTRDVLVQRLSCLLYTSDAADDM
eukprot:10536554-Prorocentrum_lima.AAC.1